MKKCKIRYKRVFGFLLIIIIIVLTFIKLFSLKITNIYISGNSYFSDQMIIEIAGLENYPKALLTTSHNLESKLNDSIYIESSNVKKKGLTRVYISVVENRPLFYDDKNKWTVLKDGSHDTLNFNLPILNNYIDSSIYDEFIIKMNEINDEVLSIISEIEYKPNDVDKKLFLLTLNDGNYIYVNTDKLDSVNRYFDMVTNFNNHKGILYLDSGEYFKILDN